MPRKPMIVIAFGVILVASTMRQTVVEREGRLPG